MLLGIFLLCVHKKYNCVLFEIFIVIYYVTTQSTQTVIDQPNTKPI